MNLNFLSPRKNTNNQAVNNIPAQNIPNTVLPPAQNTPINQQSLPKHNSDLYRLYKIANRDKWLEMKNYLIGIIAILIALMGSWFFKVASSGQATMGGWFFSLGLILLLIAFLPIVFLISNNKAFYIWCLILPFFLILPYIFQLNIFLMVSSGLLVVMFIIGGFSMKKEAENCIKFQWSRVAAKGYNWIIFSMILFVAASMYSTSPLVKNIQPLDIFNKSIEYSQKVDLSKIGIKQEIKLDMTVDELLNKTINQESQAIPEIDINALMDKLPANLKGKIVLPDNLKIDAAKQLIDAARADLSSRLGLDLTGQEKISDAIWKYFSQAFNKMHPMVKYLFYILIATLVYMTLGSIIWFIRILCLFVGWIILNFFLVIHYLKMDNKNVDQDVLVLSDKA